MAKRRQPTRAAAAAVAIQRSTQVTVDHKARRAKRHLDDLERTNYTEPSSGAAALRPSGSNMIEEENKVTKELQDEVHDKVASSTMGAAAVAKKKKKQPSTAVRMLLMYRKDLPTLMEESGLRDLPPSIPTYFNTAAAPSKVPPIKLCSVCGYLGKYQCQRCAMRYCDLACRATHDEARCERRIG